MVKDSLKNRVRFSSTLSPEVDKALKEYSQKTMIPISKILDMAIAEFINKDNGKQLSEYVIYNIF